MAKELLDGAGFWSIFNNPYFPAEGGSVVIGYMAALFFSIFGDTFFSLVLVPILFSLLILTTFYLFLERYFNRYVAIVFSFLFIFPLHHFLTFSLQAHGFHFESTLFSILGLFCFFEIFFNEANYKAYLEEKPHKKLFLLFIAFGLISGFGIYFFYTYLIMLFTIIIFWFLIDKSFIFKKYFYIFLLGLIIGLLPWILYNTTHSFSGLNIHGLKISKVMFSKNPSQIFQTFWFIITEKLPEFLGMRLYQIIIFSFGLIILSNLNSFRSLFSLQVKYLHNIKELIFIGYVLIFISTWSVLYMPLLGENIPLWMSGLWGRLFHSYPFLFALVALCFNRLLPIKKKKGYFLRMAISSAFIIWILRIGFSNYSNLVSMPGYRIDPLKVKGYSIRLAYRRGIKKIRSSLDSDMFQLGKATEYDGDLWQFYSREMNHNSLYADTGVLEKIGNNPQLDEAKKPYYYLLVGLNTGDLLEGYDTSNLNKLVAQKVPPIYRHYLYEGVAISLMNRRFKEVLKNIDFINTVPVEYRHYFLLELGRVIGEHFDDKVREEKLQYAIKRLSPISMDYVYHGLIEALITDEFLRAYQRGNIKIKKEYPPFFYRAISRRAFGKLPSENDVPNWLKDIGVDKDNEKYFYYGIIEAYFKDANIYREEEIKRKIERVIAYGGMPKMALYEGLGLSLGHLTFGHIKRFNEFIESFLGNDQLSQFYYGYCLSLKERYGEDLDTIRGLIDYNVPEQFKEMCYKIIHDQNIDKISYDFLKRHKNIFGFSILSGS
jgi:hypothetical protein